MRALHVVIPALWLAACGPSQRDGDATPTTDAAVTTTDAGKCEEVIDLVFVLDTSSSMDFVLQQDRIADRIFALDSGAPMSKVRVDAVHLRRP